MDINKEREAFLNVYVNYKGDSRKIQFNEETEQFMWRKNNVSDTEVEYVHLMNQRWYAWLACAKSKAQAVPEGFVLVPVKDAKFFSHDGDNYEVHDTLVEAKYEAECAMEHYRERLADQLSDPRSDGNFQDVGYGVVLAKSGYSIDHVVTQADIDKGDYSYEVGTEILSLFLVEVQEPTND